jgi:hypothetical protein
MGQFLSVAGTAFWIAAAIRGSVIAAVGGGVLCLSGVAVFWVEAKYIHPALVNAQSQQSTRERINT